jgi:hypothetical protein
VRTNLKKKLANLQVEHKEIKLTSYNCSLIATAIAGC